MKLSMTHNLVFIDRPKWTKGVRTPIETLWGNNKIFSNTKCYRHNSLYPTILHYHDWLLLCFYGPEINNFIPI